MGSGVALQERDDDKEEKKASSAGMGDGKREGKCDLVSAMGKAGARSTTAVDEEGEGEEGGGGGGGGAQSRGSVGVVFLSGEAGGTPRRRTESEK